MHDICCFCTGRMLCSLSLHISGGSLEITVDTQHRLCPRGILLRRLYPPPRCKHPPCSCCHHHPLPPIPFRCSRPRSGSRAPSSVQAAGPPTSTPPLPLQQPLLPINKFFLPSEFSFLPQNALFAQTPSLFAQRSTYASARTSPRISGISD